MRSKNNYEILGNMVKVEIYSNKYGYIYTTIDKEDIHILDKYKLRVKFDKTINGFYIYTGRMNNKKWEVNLLHRIITNCPKGMQVDHINRNPLDNIKSNLRVCTNIVNANNRKTRCDNKVGVRGIAYNYKKDIYTVRKNINGKRRFTRCKKRNG